MIIWLSHIVQSLLLEAVLAGCRDDKEPGLLLRASRHHRQTITYSIRSPPTLLRVHKSAGPCFRMNAYSVASVVLKHLFELG
jgi:hypothetical protein